MASSLRLLANLIVNAVDRIEQSCLDRGFNFPDLNEPFTPEADEARNDPVVEYASSIIAASAFQLLQSVRSPHGAITLASFSSYLSSALRVINKKNISELLIEAGREGMHVSEIGKHVGVDAEKLGRILRFLSTHHIFLERKPGVFANNRLSSVLHKGRTFQELKHNPGESLDSPQATLSAFVSFMTDEPTKSSAFLHEVLSDPTTASSEDPEHTAFSRAFESSPSIWSYLAEPKNVSRLKCFNIAMNVSANMNPTGLALKGFNWGSLCRGSVVVDVGGGFGEVAKAISDAYPALKVVVQDRPNVIDEARLRWEKKRSKRTVEFQGKSPTFFFHAIVHPHCPVHDFFEEQPIKNASVFFLRYITHDWSDKYAIQILRRLRESAQQYTKLISMDVILPVNGSGDSEKWKIRGLHAAEVPSPLLHNLGGGNPMPYYVDMNMMALVNGEERTLERTVNLFLKSGWKIVHIHQTDGFGRRLSQVVAEPLPLTDVKL